MKRRTTPEKIEIPPATEPSTAGPIDTATIELLAKWRVEDATDDPEEVRLAEQELAQFKQSMNQNRSLPTPANRTPPLALSS